MNSLLTLENNYHNLLKKLSLSFSARFKVQIIYEFIEDVHLKSIPVEPYLLELITELENSVKSIQPNGINPLFVQNWNKTTEILKSTVVNHFILDRLKTISYDLQSKQASLKQVISNKKFSNPNTKNSKSGISYIFETILKSQSTVNIPFVENEPLVQYSAFQFGVVRKLKVIITKISKKSEHDEVDIQLVAQKDKHHDFVKLIEYSKKLFQEITGKKITDKLSFHCSIELNNLISGNSLEAGFVTAVFIALYKLYDVKISFDFPTVHAITGGLDEQGNLTEVDDVGIKSKIESCAFSEITALLVPKTQEVFAKQFLKELEEKHEGKQLLEIIGITNIREVYFDRRNLNQFIASFPQLAIKSIWNKRRSIAAILFTIMFMVIGKVLLDHIDRHPNDIIYSGKDAIIINQFGGELMRIELGENKIDEALRMKERDEYIVELFDIDSDGYKDVVYGDNRTYFKDYEKIVCYSIRKDSVLWQVPLKKNLLISNYTFAEDKFASRMIRIGDYNKDGKPEVYVLTASNYSPCILFQLDASTGNEIAFYAHYGHLTSIKFVDLNNDGNTEILTCGTNQIFNTACLIMLDPMEMNGHGPMNEMNQFLELPEANEKYYINIPFTLVGKAFGEKAGYSMVSQMNIPLNEIKLDIRDAAIDQDIPTYYLYFDFNLKPTKCKSGDSYEKQAKALIKQKKLDRFPDPQYFKEFMKKISYLKKPYNK